MRPAQLPSPATVAALFGVRADAWEAVGGGFSGADVFAGRVAGERMFALKAWPAGSSAAHIRQLHQWMTQAAGTGLVPTVYSANGETVAEHGGRLWELLRWLPGEPDPSQPATASAAVAALHAAWRTTSTTAPFPAVARRLAALTDPRPVRAIPYADPVAVRRAVASAVRELEPLAGRVVSVHPCLCDLHAGHVLFVGDRVTGVIDYAAMKVDHPAVDLARLLGESGSIAAGVEAYRSAGGADVPVEWVEVLDRTGAVCGLLHWLRRAEAGPLSAAAVERVGRLVGRVLPATG